MRRLLPLISLLLSFTWAHAQWNIFAEKMPTPGHWAYYQVDSVKPNEPTFTSNLRLSIQDGGIVNGKPHVWFTVDSVAWLGSNSKAPLRFLLPADLDREGSYKFLESAAEILFSDPKGAWHMKPEDVSWLAKRVGYRNSCTVTPAENQVPEELILDQKKFKCQRLQMETYTIIDPPIFPKQTIIIRGDIWRDDSKPFAIIQAKWTEKFIKSGEMTTEDKTLKLLAQGKEEKPAAPIDHGDGFSFWRVIFPK